MRIVVVSDTHIPEKSDSIPPVVMDELKKADMAIHSGDFVDISVLDTLCLACKNVVAVAGNMDSDQIRARLPDRTIIKAGVFKIGLMHGIGHPAKLIELVGRSFKNDGVDMVIFGHSHTPCCRSESGVLFFNAGSPTDRIFSPYNSYGIIDITDKIDARIVKI